MKPRELDRLLHRAGYRCEYCQTVLFGMSWQREHINPRSDTGTDSFANLAASCPRCNLNKGKKKQGKDFVTGKVNPFFNPRIDKWKDHFGIVAGQIVGKTPIGRATASTLFRRTEQQLPSDLKWWPLNEINNETLYMFLNHQRARRLSNEFNNLQQAIDNIPFLKNLNEKDFQAATFATHILIAESLYTRSSVSDIKKALKVIEAISKLPNLNQARREELLNITSIVLQQLSTALMLDGKVAEAKRVQKKAIKTLEFKININGDNTIKDNLRLASMKSKIENPVSLNFEAALNRAVDEASEGQYSVSTHLADTVINQPRTFREIEKLLGHINKTMLSIGYGQDFDYAKSIIVRRRWWMLNAFVNQKCDLDLLENDILFWKKLDMQNEIRELYTALHKIGERSNSKHIKEMLHVIKKHLITYKNN